MEEIRRGLAVHPGDEWADPGWRPTEGRATSPDEPSGMDGNCGIRLGRSLRPTDARLGGSFRFNDRF